MELIKTLIKNTPLIKIIYCNYLTKFHPGMFF